MGAKHVEVGHLIAEDRHYARRTLFARRQAGNMIFVAGMLALDGGQIVGRGDIAVQTRQVLEKVKAIVEAGGGSMGDIVKTTVYITYMANFAAMNEIYKTYFSSERPAHATVKADLVNKDFLVENRRDRRHRLAAATSSSRSVVVATWSTRRRGESTTTP